jgi:asparagine synthase (glutamine-hydrolysing)
MCGIAGVVHTDPERPVAEGLVTRLCDAMRHRGPDDAGVFVDGPVGLGMRRLSIIDVEGGHQPIFNETGDVVVVMNGEIYNFRDLRADLVARGHRFATNTDTEVLVHLYEDLGEQLVGRLRGMFAFAIWDRRRRRLTLGRDRFGIKPLYVTRRPWGLAFASELKALVTAGLTDRSVSAPAIDAFLQLGYIPAPLSPFTDVEKLLPAQVLTWTPGTGATVRTYWDLPTGRRDPGADAARQTLRAIDDSVAAHLVSDVPVAAFLSGGLDSSAVVSSWAAHGLRPTVFTAQYLGSGAAEADETPLARALARRYDLELIVVPVSPRISDVFEPIVRALDEPHADDSAIPTWVLSEEVSRQFKVVLTGVGGDELFAGYRRHLGLLAAQRLSRLPNTVRRLARALAGRVPERGPWEQQAHRLRRFLLTGDGTPAEQFFRMLIRVPEEDRATLLRPDFFGSGGFDAARERFGGLLGSDGGAHHGINAGLYLDYKTFLPDDVLALSDRIAMAHSLEVRVPLVDHELVELVFPFPDRVKVGGLRPKRLLREALRERLPAAHFRAPKRGFVGPTAQWLRRELRGMIADELSPARIRRLGMFQTDTVQRLLDEHLHARRNRETILWNLLCLSVWHRLFVETPPAARPFAGSR